MKVDFGDFSLYCQTIIKNLYCDWSTYVVLIKCRERTSNPLFDDRLSIENGRLSWINYFFCVPTPNADVWCWLFFCEKPKSIMVVMFQKKSPWIKSMYVCMRSFLVQDAIVQYAKGRWCVSEGDVAKKTRRLHIQHPNPERKPDNKGESEKKNIEGKHINVFNPKEKVTNAKKAIKYELYSTIVDVI